VNTRYDEIVVGSGGEAAKTNSLPFSSYTELAFFNKVKSR
jgi:hypothetical protein